MKSKFAAPLVLASAGVCFLFFQIEIASSFGFLAIDPGVRVGPSGVGGPIAGLSDSEGKFFEAGLGDFAEPDGTSVGLGPRMNLDSCSGCHLQPEVGGTSPFVNPQVAFANKMNATNTVPSFITANGPVREARFVRNPDGTPDGGVHALFTITGRDDAPGCVLGQPAFEQELANRNVIFRIPTPTYGAGLIEEIPDSAIVANRMANASTKRLFGISGRVNKNGNDGTITRFGWKAQNKSLLLFSGEAYNVEMGITNELFQTERDETPSCQFAKVPNDVTMTSATSGVETISGIEKFAFFMRFLDQPTPSPNNPGGTPSIDRGRLQ